MKNESKKFRIIQSESGCFKVQTKGIFFGWNTVERSIAPGILTHRTFYTVKEAEDFIKLKQMNRCKKTVIGYY